MRESRCRLDAGNWVSCDKYELRKRSDHAGGINGGTTCSVDGLIVGNIEVTGVMWWSSTRLNGMSPKY